ncbi:hypothetical protein [Pelagicoccus sp. SDUM812002]|uniref:hypothetical protein n=1 Tax=Pelagicoccus sp. SDUM812002 TaxID=3041266 RepID=UPI00280D7C06|nr:hypothetical protein [Pelagicoccus sp. SDUM812002]MDQ8185068.1 hypothetical protein [Pelagicoccus sp. SDUM812002]
MPHACSRSTLPATPLKGALLGREVPYEDPFQPIFDSGTVRIKISTPLKNNLDIEKLDDFFFNEVSETLEFDHLRTIFGVFAGTGESIGRDLSITTEGTSTSLAVDFLIATGPSDYEMSFEFNKIEQTGDIRIRAYHLSDDYGWNSLDAKITSLAYHVPDSSGRAALFSFVLLLGFHAKYRRKRNI